jgi:hypothetical protein
VKQLSMSPVTMVGPHPGQLRIAESVTDDGDGLSFTVTFGPYAERQYNVTKLLSLQDNHVRFVDDYNGVITLRPVRESDTEQASNHPFFPDHALPVPVIGGIMSGTIGQTRLFAATDLDGDVHTLILESGLGLFARYGRAWTAADATGLANLNVVQVADIDLETYDRNDENGWQTTLAMLTPDQSPSNVTSIVVEPREIVASAPITAPLIASLDDAQVAIDFAADETNAGSRWFVEKRLRALGHTEPFPWEM